MLEKLKKKMEHVRDAVQEIAANTLSDRVSEEVYNYRYGICSSCDKLYKPTDSCKLCGCFMKVKCWMPKQSCPAGKWPAETKNV